MSIISTELISSSSSSSSSSLTSSSISSKSSILSDTTAPKEDELPGVWKKFLENTTEKMGGVDPQDAQIIFLGNIHVESWQKEWRGDVIAHYGGKDPIVLCEGVEALQPMSMKAITSFTPKAKVLAYGWDDGKLFKDKSLVKAWFALNDKNKDIPLSQWSEADRLELEKIAKDNSVHCMRRTHSLIKSARSILRQPGALKDGQKLIVVAGSDHLFDTTGYNVLNYFKGTKAALLGPKELNIAPEAFEEYRSKLRSIAQSLPATKSTAS